MNSPQFPGFNIVVSPTEISEAIPSKGTTNVHFYDTAVPFHGALFAALIDAFPNSKNYLKNEVFACQSFKQMSDGIGQLDFHISSLSEAVDSYLKLRICPEANRLKQVLKILKSELSCCYRNGMTPGFDEAMFAANVWNGISKVISHSDMILIVNAARGISNSSSALVQLGKDTSTYFDSKRILEEHISETERNITKLEEILSRPKPARTPTPAPGHEGQAKSSKFGKKEKVKKPDENAERLVRAKKALKTAKTNLEQYKKTFETLEDSAPPSPALITEKASGICGHAINICASISDRVRDVKKEEVSVNLWNRLSAGFSNLLGVAIESKDDKNIPNSNVGGRDTFFEACLNIENNLESVVRSYAEGKKRGDFSNSRPTLKALINYAGHIFKHGYLLKFHDTEAAAKKAPIDEEKFIVHIQESILEVIKNNKFYTDPYLALKIFQGGRGNNRKEGIRQALRCIFFEAGITEADKYIEDYRIRNQVKPGNILRACEASTSPIHWDIRALYPAWPQPYSLMLTADSKDSLSIAIIDKLQHTIQLNVYFPGPEYPATAILGESSRINPHDDRYGERPSRYSSAWISEKLIPWLAFNGIEKLYIRSHFPGEQGGLDAKTFFYNMGFREDESIASPFMVLDLSTTNKPYSINGDFIPLKDANINSKVDSDFAESNKLMRDKTLAYFYAALNLRDKEELQAAFEEIQIRYQSVSDINFDSYSLFANLFIPKLYKD